MWSLVTALGGQIEFMEKIFYLLSAPSTAQKVCPRLWTIHTPLAVGQVDAHCSSAV